MLQQKYYVKHCVPGLTPGELRSLADLMEHETLPADPFTILSLEALGYVVDLETGDITSEIGAALGNVAELVPLAGNLPPVTTLIDVLKLPGMSLVNNEKLLHWSEVERSYILQDFRTNQTNRFAACAPALTGFVGGEL